MIVGIAAVAGIDGTGDNGVGVEVGVGVTEGVGAGVEVEVGIEVGAGAVEGVGVEGGTGGGITAQLEKTSRPIVSINPIKNGLPCASPVSI